MINFRTAKILSHPRNILRPPDEERTELERLENGNSR